MSSLGPTWNITKFQGREEAWQVILQRVCQGCACCKPVGVSLSSGIHFSVIQVKVAGWPCSVRCNSGVKIVLLQDKSGIFSLQIRTLSSSVT